MRRTKSAGLSLLRRTRSESSTWSTLMILGTDLHAVDAVMALRTAAREHGPVPLLVQPGVAEGQVGGEEGEGAHGEPESPVPPEGLPCPGSQAQARVCTPNWVAEAFQSRDWRMLGERKPASPLASSNPKGQSTRGASSSRGAPGKRREWSGLDGAGRPAPARGRGRRRSRRPPWYRRPSTYRQPPRYRRPPRYRQPPRIGGLPERPGEPEAGPGPPPPGRTKRHWRESPGVRLQPFFLPKSRITATRASMLSTSMAL